MEEKNLQLLRKNGYLIGGAAAAVYIIAAWFSKGYYHPDEHYQILEFAGLKLGKLRPDDLPWEYRMAIRPSFQPWLAYWAIRLMNGAHLFNPYIQAFLLRCWTAVFALFAIGRFIRSNIRAIPDCLRLWYVGLSYFLWFLPFINARFSSETWSGIFILLAVSMIPYEGERAGNASLWVGVFCGLAFLCRFQTGVMFFGILLWLAFIKRASAGRLAAIGVMWLAVVLLGILLDRLYYGRWVVSFWNYFDANIIKGVASAFGTTPWYIYIYQVVLAQVFPLGILVLLCFLVVLVEDGKSLLLWSICPLLVCHLAVGHKELRFLFPLANFLPLLIIRGVQYGGVKLGKEGFPGRRAIVYSLLLAGVGMNLVAMAVSIALVPSFGRIALTEFVYHHYPKEQVVIYSLNREELNPFVPYSFIRQSFYEMPNVSQARLDRYENLQKKMFEGDTVPLLVCRKMELNDPVLAYKIDQLHMKELFGGNPEWALAAAGIYSEELEQGEYVLYGRR